METLFSLGDTITININHITGLVRGIFVGVNQETPRYQVQYVNTTGSVKEEWFNENDLTKN